MEALIKASPAYQFAADVLAGKIVSGKRRIQACERFMRELEQSQLPSYPWRFDIKKAYLPIDFMERFLVPTKGDYDKLVLQPWQHFVEANLFGWVDKKTGLRRFREGLILVASGNGKSTMVVGNAVYMLSVDGERGAEVYCLANSKEQARIIFDESRAQVAASGALSRSLRVTRDGIYFDPLNGKMQPLASDSKNLDGRNVHLGIFDEIQEYRDYKLVNVIKAKTKKRKQPLILYISTLGTVIDGVLMDYYTLGGAVLDGSAAISKRAADRMFVYIDEIDENDDPNDVSCWGKANPSLGALLDIETLIDEWERVKAIPAERSNFINKQLNVFTTVDELSFLDAQTILKNNKTISVDRLGGMRCYGGFDLSETEDFTAACLLFPLASGEFFLLEHTWVPQNKAKEDREKLDWYGLAKAGHMTLVDGEYVDYQLVFDWFVEQSKKYKIETIGYDRAKAFLLVQQMQEAGFVMNEVRQGELTLTAPMDDLKERFLDGKIITNNDPLYLWYLRNVKLSKRSVNGTYLPTRMNKNRKIDGFAAHLNAHTEWLRQSANTFDTEKRVTRVIRLEV